MVGVPNALAVKVGGRVEGFLRGAFLVVCLIAMVGLVLPQLATRFNLQIWTVH